MSFAYPCEVVSVHDGDTMHVRDSSGRVEKIRLYGVDCPELGQEYGDAAREITAGLEGEYVDIQPIGGRSWGRIVALVELPDGPTLQATLVEDGLAWVDDRFCRRLECDGWRQEQARAKYSQRGFWVEDDPLPPWQWRRAKKNDR